MRDAMQVLSRTAIWTWDCVWINPARINRPALLERTTNRLSGASGGGDDPRRHTVDDQAIESPQLEVPPGVLQQPPRRAQPRPRSHQRHAAGPGHLAPTNPIAATARTRSLRWPAPLAHILTPPFSPPSSPD